MKRISRVLACLLCGVATTHSYADEVERLVTKTQFDQIFPLSNGALLKQQYTNAYNNLKANYGEYAAALDKCQPYETKKDWAGQEKCLQENAPNFSAARAKLDNLAGYLQNCPAITVLDSSGNRVSFKGEKPNPSTIKSIETLYTYENFIKTALYFNGFVSGDRVNAKRELAALLANVQQETTGLCFASETPFDILEKLNTASDFNKFSNEDLILWMNDSDKQTLTAQGIELWSLSDADRLKVINYILTVKKPKGKYCQWSSNPTGQQECLSSNNYYYGRGAIQLSYPYNYIAFGNTDFVKSKGYNLLENPGLVTDKNSNQPNRSSLLWGSAIWFWMTPQSPKPSPHDVMNNSWNPTAADIKNNRKPGFGTVINIINGGLECGSGRGSDKDVKAQNRIDNYKRILRIIGAPQDDNSKYPLDCKNSNNFNYQ